MDEQEQYVYLVQNCDSENSCALFQTDQDARNWIDRRRELTSGNPFIVRVPTHTPLQLSDLQEVSSNARTLWDTFKDLDMVPEHCISFQ